MKIKVLSYILAIFCLLVGGATPAFAQGTAFIYQGRLTDGTNAANGNYDLRFYLRDALVVGNPVGSTNTLAPMVVSNGLFTVTLDFGAGIFTGPARWLEIGVRTNGSVAAYATLTPRQALTATPYAIFAATAASVASNAVAGVGLQDGTISAVKIAPGQVVKTINGLTDNIVLSAGANVTLTTNGNSLQVAANGGASSGWALGGNAGTVSSNFLGTSDNRPVELRANGVRGLRLEPTADTPNIIGNPVVNFVSPGMQGVTIAGGGSIATYGGVYSNSVASFHGTIGGGLGNMIRSNSFESTISGSNQNAIQINAGRSTIGGGILNSIQDGASSSTIAGGYVNTIQTNAANSTIGGGSGNIVQFNSPSGTIAGGANNIIQSNAVLSTIGGGLANSVSSGYSTIGGGQQNLASGSQATVGGGFFNSATDLGSTVSGGSANHAGGDAATVGGGQNNSATGVAATIPGGSGNSVTGLGSFAAGVNAHDLYDESFIWGGGSHAANSTGTRRFEVLATGGINLYPGAANVSIATPSALAFGGTPRLLINLYDDGTYKYDMGVQSSTLYQRSGTGGGFAWYSGGAYNINQNNPGGGATLMTLDSVGDLHINNNFTATTVLASTSFNDAISGVVSFGRGVYGSTTSAGPNYAGVWGENSAPGGTAMVAHAPGSGSTGLYAYGTQWAGYFDGPVTVCTLTIRDGCDVAEPFQMSHAEILKGSVVVIDDKNAGQLKLSDRAYDSRVAGIVSGANGVNPGIAMHQEGEFEGGQNVALSGRVYVLADATNGSITPGDLLTTSSTPGHAMKVTDHNKAQGAILGKAMSPLKSGKGMVLVLVTLQ